MTEYFDVVNEKNEILGTASREECHAKGLLHRAIHVIVFNNKGEILPQKRSATKDLYPSCWVDAVAGHVEAGESYAQAARREMQEELGIDTVPRKLFTLRKRHTGKGFIDNEFIVAFAVVHNGHFTIAQEEAVFAKFFPADVVATMLKNEPFTPGTLAVHDELRRRPALLKRLGLS